MNIKVKEFIEDFENIYKEKFLKENNICKEITACMMKCDFYKSNKSKDIIDNLILYGFALSNANEKYCIFTKIDYYNFNSDGSYTIDDDNICKVKKLLHMSEQYNQNETLFLTYNNYGISYYDLNKA